MKFYQLNKIYFFLKRKKNIKQLQLLNWSTQLINHRTSTLCYFFQKKFFWKKNYEFFFNPIEFNNFINFFFIKFSKWYHTKLLFRTNYQIKNKSNPSSFISLIMKRGGKLKYETYYNYTLMHFFNIFLFFNDEFKQNFPFYIMFFNFSKDNVSFFNLNFLVDFFSTFLTSLFKIKVSKISSKIRKKQKTTNKFEFEYNYIIFNKRKKWIISQLILNSWSHSYRSLTLRLYYTLVYTLLNWKFSELYKMKIEIYNFVLSKKKNKLLK